MIERLLQEISANKGIRIETLRDEYVISVKENGNFDLILRIYLSGKTAEFIDIEDEWDELDYAIQDKYGKFPEIKRVVDYLNNNNYSIIW